VCYLPNDMLVCFIQVLEVLSSSSELADLLYKVDVAYHSRPSCSSESDDVVKFVPSIREQLKVGYNSALICCLNLIV
jgi:sphingomyelin phosphodiesterase 4